MAEFEVEFYETTDGDKPAKDFLISLDNKMRAKVGSDITRVMYFFYIDRRVILTNGFVKKTKKTPLKELEKAKKYRQDYLRRKGVDDGRKV